MESGKFLYGQFDSVELSDFAYSPLECNGVDLIDDYQAGFH